MSKLIIYKISKVKSEFILPIAVRNNYMLLRELG